MADDPSQSNIPIPIPQATDPGLQAVGEITNVNADIGAYVKAKYSKQLAIAGFVVGGFEILWLIFIFVSGNVNVGTVEVALVPVGFVVVGYIIIKNKLEDAFFQQFAAKNGFTFEKKGLPGNLDGNLFSIGHSPSGKDLVAGNFQNLPLQLFNYQYTVGYGKNSQTYHDTIFCLDYPENLPPIFLQVKGHNFGEDIFGYFSINDPEKIQLEGDFNNFFTLYTKKGFETEALQVFAPDFMEKIQTDWKSFSLEFVNQHLYIYCYHTISTKTELDNMYSLAQYLVERIQPLAEKMKSSLTALEGYYDSAK